MAINRIKRIRRWVDDWTHAQVVEFLEKFLESDLGKDQGGRDGFDREFAKNVIGRRRPFVGSQLSRVTEIVLTYGEKLGYE